MDQLSLHSGKLPEHIGEKEVNKCLADLARQSKTPSLSDFKFTVYIRYTHKTVISNHRLLAINDNGVNFRWRDYRDNR